MESLNNMSDFAQKVYDVVRTIPKGRVATYAGIAKAIGSPRAVRAVGTALGKNRNFKQVPCHRVVRSDGRIGQYVFGTDKKVAILRKEGVEVNHNSVDLTQFGTNLS